MDIIAKHWIYKPAMNLMSAFVLPYVLFSVIRDQKEGWLTR